jgi:hypothetical protein
MKKINLEKCIWRYSYENGGSSFQNVDETHETLAKCKYECDGFDKDCEGYKPLGKFKTYKEQVKKEENCKAYDYMVKHRKYK